jgi:hypothetical protein
LAGVGGVFADFACSLGAAEGFDAFVGVVAGFEPGAAGDGGDSGEGGVGVVAVVGVPAGVDEFGC